MIKAYYFIREKRIRKKLDLYKLFLSITIDWVIVLYIMLFLGYVSYAVLKVGKIPPFLFTVIFYINQFLQNNERLLLIIGFIPILYVFRSFQRPGIDFSSGEYLLSLLPYRTKSIWFLSALEQFVKQLLFVVLVAITVYVVSPFSLGKVIVFSSFIWLMLVSMTIVQWKLFQLHTLWKMAIVIILFIFQGSIVSFGNMFTIICYSLFLIGIVIYALAFLLERIDWEKVVATNDYFIWNVKIISQATKIKFQREGHSSIWYRFNSWKEKFTYEKEAIYSRLWYIYGEKQMTFILRLTGGLLLLLSIVSYFSKIYFVIAGIVAIHIQTFLLVSLFNDRLHSDVMNALPWDLNKLRRTFIHWGLLISIILIVPISFYATYYFNNVSIIYVIFIMLLFHIILDLKLLKSLQQFKHTNAFYGVFEFFMYGLFIVFVISVKLFFLQMISLIIFVILYVRHFRLRKHH